VFVATGVVVTVKEAMGWPAATVTLAGTCAAGLLLTKVTTAPPVGATLLNVTVPVEEVPPTTEVGFRVTVLSTADVTVKLAFWVAP